MKNHADNAESANSTQAGEQGAWTKGPWRIRALSSSFRIYSETANNVEICKIEKSGFIHDANLRKAADAALIAAAPELFDALVMARECIAYCRRTHPDAQRGEGFPVEIFIDAALRKARGAS